MDEKELKQQIEQSLLKKDWAKMTKLINDGVPLSCFCIKDKTDILLESIVNKKIIIFNNLLNANFDIINGHFLYLHHAVRTHEIRYVKAIMKKVNNDFDYLNKTDEVTGDNALHIAMRKKVDLPFIMELSNSKISWNTHNKNGQTPLHLLLRQYLIIDELLIDELINVGADFSKTDNLGISSLDIVNSFKYDKEWSEMDCTKYLLQKLEEEYA